MKDKHAGPQSERNEDPVCGKELWRLVFSFVKCVLVLVIWFLPVRIAEGALTSEEMESSLCKATVRVVIFEGGNLQGHGTGFLISPEGHIATNKHVAIEGGSFGVLYSDRSSVWLRKAEVIGRSPGSDLAILKIDPIPGMNPLAVYAGEAQALQDVAACGFPGVLDRMTWATGEGVELDKSTGKGRFLSEEAKADFVPVITSGKVTKAVMIEGTRVLHHTVKISGGNSGGALVDADGRVVGINTAILRADGDYAISIQSPELISLAETLKVRLKTSTAKATAPGTISLSQKLLWGLVVLFAAVMFLMVMRKPRMVVVDAMSRVVSLRRTPPPPPPDLVPSTFPPTPVAANRSFFRLHGKDREGRIYEVTFKQEDFHRARGRLVIGRNRDLCGLCIPHDSVSRQHATLTLDGGVVRVEDRNSGNGTILNGRSLVVGMPPMPLRHGDRLTMGEVDLIFDSSI